MDRGLAMMAAVVLTPSLVLAASVARDKYDTAVANAEKAHLQLTNAEAQLGKLQSDLDAAEAQTQERDRKLTELTTSGHNVEAQLDEETAINANLRGELERLGKNVDQMLQDKGTLAKALDDAKARLEELRQAQVAAEARAALFQQFVQKFKAMIDAGQLELVTRNGRLVLQLSNDVLFDSGQTAIKPAGRSALLQVAKVLATVQGRTFQVAGHTDNVPIQNVRFPSNWELSTARALEVVKLLVAQGVAPGELSAAGFGEFDPIADNDTPDGRAKNRRIEITLQPNLDELVAAPQIQ